MKKIMLYGLFMAISYSGHSQIIQNGDFEDATPVTDHGQISNATGWSCENLHYPVIYGGGIAYPLMTTDLFEIDGPCASQNSYDIPANKWSDNLPSYNDVGSRYIGGGGTYTPENINANVQGEFALGTLTEVLNADQGYVVSFNHAPIDRVLNCAGPSSFDPLDHARNFVDQEMWITLRLDSDSSQGLVIQKVILSPVENTWGTYTFGFSLTAEEALVAWDRIEFMARYRDYENWMTDNWLDSFWFLDNASMVEGDCETSYEDVLIRDYCVDPFTVDCPLYFFNHLMGEWTLVENREITANVFGVSSYQARCVDEDGCLTITNYTVSLIPRESEFTTLYACDDDCNWYIPPHEGEFDYYHLTGISGPNNDEYDYNTIDGYVNGDGHHHIGWASHCLLIGGSYLIEYYNFDEHGNPTCLTKTLTVTVEDGSVECPEDMEYSICEGDCQEIGFEHVQSGTYSWLDAIFIDGNMRTVCPTETTTYQLEFTNTFGCKCTTDIVVNVADPDVSAPPLFDEEICVGEEYCLTLDYSDEFFDNTNLITFDLGPGMVNTYVVVDGFDIPTQCRTYDSPGDYPVSITYYTDCGPIVVSCMITVTELRITDCGDKLYSSDPEAHGENSWHELPEFINLEEIYEIYGDGDCCEGLLSEGVWVDGEGNEILDPHGANKDLLLSGGVTKEYIDLENCTKCTFTVYAFEGDLYPESPGRDTNSDSNDESEIHSLDETSNVIHSEALDIEGEVNLKNQFKLAPNPSMGNFRIVNSNNLNSYDGVKIYSIDGKLIFTDTNTDVAVIYDLSNNKSGIYIIEISTGETVQRLRLVLQN